MYRDWTKEQKKESENYESEVESLKQKELKFYEKISDNNDLLENEIILVDKFEATDDLIIKWGNQVFKSWENLLKN
jgi:hypothetical protein